MLIPPYQIPIKRVMIAVIDADIITKFQPGTDCLRMASMILTVVNQIPKNIAIMNKIVVIFPFILLKI